MDEWRGYGINLNRLSILLKPKEEKGATGEGTDAATKRLGDARRKAVNRDW